MKTKTDIDRATQCQNRQDDGSPMMGVASLLSCYALPQQPKTGTYFQASNIHTCLGIGWDPPIRASSHGGPWPAPSNSTVQKKFVPVFPHSTPALHPSLFPHLCDRSFLRAGFISGPIPFNSSPFLISLLPLDSCRLSTCVPRNCEREDGKGCREWAGKKPETCVPDSLASRGRYSTEAGEVGLHQVNVT